MITAIDLTQAGPVHGIGDTDVRGEIAPVIHFDGASITIDESQARCLKRELEFWLDKNATLKPTNPDDIPF